MADREWYEIPGTTGDISNLESATLAARSVAASTDDVVEIYQCTRTLVRTVQRNVTIQETDVTTTP
jgi:hypothetical protein